MSTEDFLSTLEGFGDFVSQRECKEEMNALLTYLLCTYLLGLEDFLILLNKSPTNVREHEHVFSNVFCRFVRMCVHV